MYTKMLRKIVKIGQWFAGNCSGDGGNGHCS